MTETQRNVILLGPPGAGKGTQAERIVAGYALPHISTGEMLRAAVAEGTEMGLAAQKFMAAGALVPDEVVIGVVRDRLAQADAQKGFLLDGFPRTAPQARWLAGLLAERGQKIDSVLLLEVPDHVLMERMLARGRADDTVDLLQVVQLLELEGRQRGHRTIRAVHLELGVQFLVERGLEQLDVPAHLTRVVQAEAPEHRRDLNGRDGGAAFAALGIPKSGGTKMTCLTGHVNKPGVYELKLGFPVKQMIEEVGGGIRHGKKLKAFIPGGSSCPVLTAAEVEGATMDYDSMASRKTMLGSGGVIIMDEDTCMVKAALRIMRFYAHESCGWCIPCREGTTWLKKILTRFHDGAGTRTDIDLIGDIARNMLGRTFCPLGDAAAMPTISIVEKFRQEFEDHLNGKPCPYEHSESTVAV